MLIGLIVLTISFFLDGTVSNYLPFAYDQLYLLKTMFTIISLIVIFPYFNHNDKKYYQVAILFGLLYDVVYTNSFPLNTILFLLLALFIKKINEMVAYHYFNVLITTFTTIVFADLINVMVLNIINYTNINLYAFLYKIGNSLLINLIYISIIYIILEFVSHKYKIKRLN